MKLSNLLVLIVSAAVATLATPVPEPISDIAARTTVELLDVPAPAPGTNVTIQRRQNLVVQVCGGANWTPCTNVNVYAHTHVYNPYNTFGSFNTNGNTCHCFNGASTYSNPFVGAVSNVKTSWGDYWFFNCQQIGCW